MLENGDDTGWISHISVKAISLLINYFVNQQKADICLVLIRKTPKITISFLIIGS